MRGANGRRENRLDLIWQKFTDWLKEILIGGITDALSGLFDTVNTRVGEIAGQVGATPQGWNGGIYNMIRSLSDNVILPIAGVILAIVMTMELIQIITDKNNMHGEVDTWFIFKWVFKTACAVLIVSNKWNIVMGVFDVAQSVVNNASGVVVGNVSLDLASSLADLEARLNEMEVWSLLGLWLQATIVKLTMNALNICIFIIVYGRMIEIYLVTSIAPIPMATAMNREWGQMGQNYLRSLFALGFQGFLIIICVAIYAVLVQNMIVELYGLYGAFVLHTFQDRFSCQEPVQQPLTEVIASGLCTRPKGLERRKDQSPLQFDQAAACLLRRRRGGRRAAVLSAPAKSFQQRGGDLHDRGHVAVLPLRLVREKRPAAGEDHQKYCSGLFHPPQGAAL